LPSLIFSFSTILSGVWLDPGFDCTLNRSGDLQGESVGSEAGSESRVEFGLDFDCELFCCLLIIDSFETLGDFISFEFLESRPCSRLEYFGVDFGE